MLGSTLPPSQSHPFPPRPIHLTNHHHSHSRTQDKVIIITGCNSPLGIGRASAHHFANNGAKAIYICDLNPEHLETHKREINSLYPGTEIHPREVNAAEEDDVKRVVDEALEKYGRLDVFFANAGISINPKSVLESTTEDFKMTMEINAMSYVSCLPLSPTHTHANGFLILTLLFQRFPRRQTRRPRHARHFEIQTLPERQHNRRRLVRRSTLQRRTHRLQRQQSGRHQYHANVLLPTHRNWDSLQRALSWDNRNRYDVADVRDGAREGNGEEDWPTESADEGRDCG